MCYNIVREISSSTATTGIGGIGSATIGAAVAGLLVILVGALVRAPLKQVPENTLKFIVGLSMPSRKTPGIQPWGYKRCSLFGAWVVGNACHRIKIMIK